MSNLIDRIKNNIKTTTIGVLAGAIVIILKVFGIDVSDEVITAVLTVIVTLLGLLSKD